MNQGREGQAEAPGEASVPPMGPLAGRGLQCYAWQEIFFFF